MALNLANFEAMFKSFVEAHPEIVADGEGVAKDVAEAVAAPSPERFYDIIRALIPLVTGITDARRAEMVSAVTQHEQEHAALVAALPAPKEEQ